jgi:hypothetical protein
LRVDGGKVERVGAAVAGGEFFEGRVGEGAREDVGGGGQRE